MKVLRKIGLGFAFALISICLSSCSSDDDEPTVEQKEMTASFKYSLTVSQGLLDLAEVTVSFVSPSDKVKQKLTQTSFEKETKIKSFPASASAGIAIKWKEGIDAATADGKKLSVQLSHNASTSDGTNQTFQKTLSMTVDGEKVNEALPAFQKSVQNYNYTYKFAKNADGKLEVSSSAY